MKKLPVFCLLAFVSAALPAAPNMQAEVGADMRAATAAAAKREAADSAVRSGVMQVLARYSDRMVVENLIAGADEQALQNLVAAMSISNERQSKTAYSAKFSITLDRAAVEKWYADNNVPNFLSAADESSDRTVISIDLSGLGDWAELNRIVREDGTNFGLTLRSIFRNSATAYILANKRRRFQTLVASGGWTVSSRDGVVRIAKQ
ncbi:MAG: hypothetical protein LBL21_02750 [Rickettsiales bacterium]|jgi:hypothetical protein|nr:hypothetical protein [Rickettsiales bacterium]